MKIVCEVPLQAGRDEEAQFHWLAGPDNFLVSFENKRRFRVFSITNNRAHLNQEASLGRECKCTGFAWNKDESLLAAIVNKLDIYIWEVRNNNFTKFKTDSWLGSGLVNQLSAGSQPRGRPNKLTIELVAWSKLTNKLAICYTTGQLLLCEVKPSSSGSTHQTTGANSATRTFSSGGGERFIDNSEGVLKRIVSIEVSDQADLFICITAASELLIMTFDGRSVFYSQADAAHLHNAKFSPIKREFSHVTGDYLGCLLHVAYQADSSTIYTKSIAIDMESEFHQDNESVAHVLREDKPRGHADGQTSLTGAVQPVIDFYWLGPAKLLVCLSSGSIQMIELDAAPTSQDEQLNPRTSWPLTGGAIVLSAPGVSSRIQRTELLGGDQHGMAWAALGSSSSSSSPIPVPPQAPPPDESPKSKFRIFEVIKAPERRDTSQSFAIAVGTSHRLYYYELFQSGSGASAELTMEHFDDIDLSEALERVGQKLERARWSRDCSLLALQLTSGHLVVYRTRLQDYMVSSLGARTAYLSSPNEVTILNFGPIERSHSKPASVVSDESANQAGVSPTPASSEGARMLNIQLRPSVLAIGNRHLAVALNNRVRYYSLSANESSSEFFYEKEYASIVVAVCLSSRFAAVQFDDDHVKLHSMRREFDDVTNDEIDNQDGEDFDDRERFFPDPSKPEHISAFTLTERLFVYASRETRLTVFCLKSWRVAQVCEHSPVSTSPIRKLRQNVCGNKFACLTGTAGIASQHQGRLPGRNWNRAPNAFLYDVYSNEVYPISPPAQSLWTRILRRQLQLTCATLPLSDSTIDKLQRETGLIDTIDRRPAMINVLDAIWDTDGRALVLIEQKYVHVLSVLDHTLEREEPVVEYAASVKKPLSYTTLYVTQGIVSNQSSLGRVINSILESHNEDLKLCQLEARVQAIRNRCQRELQQHQRATSDGDDKSATGDDETFNLRDINSAEVLLKCQLEVMLRKVSYICTALPIYTLTRCRGICKLLTDEKAFNLDPVEPTPSSHRLVNQIIWRVLAAWSLFTLNLDFAALVYRSNNLLVHSEMLNKLLEDTQRSGSNLTRLVVRDRVLALLGLLHMQSRQ